jgi:hypothetical protein
MAALPLPPPHRCRCGGGGAATFFRNHRGAAAARQRQIFSRDGHLCTTIIDISSTYGTSVISISKQYFFFFLHKIFDYVNKYKIIGHLHRFSSQIDVLFI